MEDEDTSSAIKVLIVDKPLIVEEALQTRAGDGDGVRMMGIGRDLAETARFLADA